MFKRLGDFANYFFTGGAEPIQKTKKKIRHTPKDAPEEVQSVVAKAKSAPEPTATRPQKKKDPEVSRIRKENRKNPAEEWEADLEEPAPYEPIESTAQQRVRKITEVKKVSVDLPFQPPAIPSKRRQMLFINPGEKAIKLAAIAMQKGWELPK